MKYILMLDTPFWLCVSIALLVWNNRLRTRIKGLNDPRLYLSKGERRAWARKELEQQEEDRNTAQFERNLGIVQGNHNREETL